MQKATNTLSNNGGEKRRLSTYLAQDQTRRSLINSMGEKEAQRFVSSLCTMASQMPQINECDYTTVVAAGLKANELKLPMSNQLGYCYILPFKDNKNTRLVATFIPGYRGYIQLAIRSGQYRRINVLEVKQSEFKGWNPWTEELCLNMDFSNINRDKEPTIGYAASFELLNGFTKTIYWRKEQMLAHAARYSKAFHLNAEKGFASYEDYVAGKYPKEDEWKYSSYWYKDFDGMAKKTMIRQLIGKWGIMSVDMQTALEVDIAADKAREGMTDFDDAPFLDVDTAAFAGQSDATLALETSSEAATGEISDVNATADDLFGEAE